MKYDDLNILNASSTDEIKQKLSATDNLLTVQKVADLIKQAINKGYAQGFREAQKMYKIDAKNIDNIIKGL